METPFLYGPDTPLLLERLETIKQEWWQFWKSTKLYIDNLRITSLPYSLSPFLTHLYCAKTQISSLPPLSSCLVSLDCSYTPILQLPDLPTTLRYLTCSNTNLTSLPELPNTLEYLLCSNTLLRELPELPLSLHTLECNTTSLILQREETESIQGYARRWRIWKEQKESKQPPQDKTNHIKED